MCPTIESACNRILGNLNTWCFRQAAVKKVTSRWITLHSVGGVVLNINLFMTQRISKKLMRCVFTTLFTCLKILSFCVCFFNPYFCPVVTVALRAALLSPLQLWQNVPFRQLVMPVIAMVWHMIRAPDWAVDRLFFYYPWSWIASICNNVRDK
jgi:hypothetical protein